MDADRVSLVQFFPELRDRIRGVAATRHQPRGNLLSARSYCVVFPSTAQRVWLAVDAAGGERIISSQEDALRVCEWNPKLGRVTDSTIPVSQQADSPQRFHIKAD